LYFDLIRFQWKTRFQVKKITTLFFMKSIQIETI
jgi:hypothetical protein